MTAETLPPIRTDQPSSKVNAGAPLEQARRWVSLSTISLLLITVLIAAPMAAVTASLFTPSQSIDAQAHIWTTTGPRYLFGTVGLCLSVGISAGVIGAGAAFLTALTEFPGRRILGVLLAAPLAVPAYIAAYVYGDLFSPFGAVGAFLRFIGAPSAPIRSLAGAAFVLTLCTYPYVYLAVRAVLTNRSSVFFEAARSLGARPATVLQQVLFPLIRPALAGGVALCLMETAGDFGVAEYYGVPTLSTGVFRVWRGLGDVVAAAQLAAGLFLIAIFLVWLESAARRGRRDDGARGGRAPQRLALRGVPALTAVLACLAPSLFGFLIPVLTLTTMAVGDSAQALSTKTIDALTNTIWLAGLGAVVTTAIGGGLAFSVHLRSMRRTKRALLQTGALRIATLGYALPGALVAVGILQLISFFPEGLRGPLIAGSGGALLLYAYVVRFLTIGHDNAAAGLAQITPSFFDAARTMGVRGGAIFHRIHLPLIRPSMLAGLAIVFIDIAKELPATLILRPFGMETLATSVYRLASDERVAEASIMALTLIALGLLPLAIIGLLNTSHLKSSR